MRRSTHPAEILLGFGAGLLAALSVIAGTWSDANSRYMLCGLVPGDSVGVVAYLGPRGYPDFFTVTGTAQVDIELKR